jgi:NAD(P)-dependent dehydrogenase (short-subunit alcohol dehydrogenase family)
VLIANGGGHIVNVLSLLSLASMPPMAGYSASKAATHSLTQELRPVLAAQGISVHGVSAAAGLERVMVCAIGSRVVDPQLELAVIELSRQVVVDAGTTPS